MAAWPGTLPQALNIGGEEARQQAFIRNQPDNGPALQRKRFTAAYRNLSGSVFLTAAQRVTFDTFYKTTLGEGADSFTWVDPVDNSTSVYMRFVESPSFTAVVGGASGVQLWRMTMKLEILP